MSGQILTRGVPQAIPARGLTEETCAKWKYYVANLEGEPVQIANYSTDGVNISGQKLRTKDKKFSVRGSLGELLYGQWLWKSKGRRVVITEGELDAMSISQVQDHKWPVVSLPNGASGAKKAIAANLQWLSGFEEVVLCFDMDDAGQKAVKECAPILPPGRLKVVRLPLKDANDMLKAGRTEELVNCLWNAQEYRPDGIVTAKDVLDKVLKEPETGLPWCLPKLNEETFGRRLGEAVAVGAGTGIGKTTLITQQIAFDLKELGQTVAVFAFEQLPSETVKRVAGQMVGKTFHIPKSGWTQDELTTTVNREEFSRLFLYDHFGACDWEVVRERIRYLRHSHGVRLFYIDHLTALAAAADDERVALEKIMAEVGGIVKELNIWLLFVSHLATPEGTPHEEGGRVKIRHFKGSRAIGFWSHFMFGLERDQQSSDEGARGTTVLRVLKDRYTGRSTGLTIPLTYDTDSGLLKEDDCVSFTKAEGEEPF